MVVKTVAFLRFHYNTIQSIYTSFHKKWFAHERLSFSFKYIWSASMWATSESLVSIFRHIHINGHSLLKINSERLLDEHASHTINFTGQDSHSNLRIYMYIHFNPHQISSETDSKIPHTYSGHMKTVTHAYRHENCNLNLDALLRNIEQLEEINDYYCITQYIAYDQKCSIIKRRTWNCRQRLHQQNCIEWWKSQRIRDMLEFCQ